MKNQNTTIIEDILTARDGLYTHYVEVETLHELESFIEAIVKEFEDQYTSQQIIDFISTLNIHYLGEDTLEESQVYDFDLEAYAKERTSAS